MAFVNGRFGYKDVYTPLKHQYLCCTRSQSTIQEVMGLQNKKMRLQGTMDRRSNNKSQQDACCPRGLWQSGPHVSQPFLHMHVHMVNHKKRTCWALVICKIRLQGVLVGGSGAWWCWWWWWLRYHTARADAVRDGASFGDRFKSVRYRLQVALATSDPY